MLSFFGFAVVWYFVKIPTGSKNDISFFYQYSKAWAMLVPVYSNTIWLWAIQLESAGQALLYSTSMCFALFSFPTKDQSYEKTNLIHFPGRKNAISALPNIRHTYKARKLDKIFQKSFQRFRTTALKNFLRHLWKIYWNIYYIYYIRCINININVSFSILQFIKRWENIKYNDVSKLQRTGI